MIFAFLALPALLSAPVRTTGSDDLPPLTGVGRSACGGSSVYTSKDGDYSISFPEKPKEQAQTTKTTKGDIHFILATCTANAGKRAYVSSSTRYPFPSNSFNVQKGLDGAREGVAKNIKATINSEKKITLNGVAGREIEMSTEAGIKARCRLFADNSGAQPVLYQAFVVDAGGNINSPEVDAFLRSLQLKKKR